MITTGPDTSTPSVAELRSTVREFCAQLRRAGRYVPMCDGWLSGFDADFSRALGAHGWIGLTWPVEYGGAGLSQRHRFAVVEELLGAGAPVAAHWMADRQSGPALLRYGSETQKLRYLPAIAAGACFFAVGMSEPDSGSDLASVRTSATRTADGWIINGRKLWTSHAHRVHHMIALCRTSQEDDRHAGLSQFIVDLRADGITVNPVLLMDGSHDFNEVVLDDVHVPHDALLGAEGDGWAQVTQELVFERSGPERFLSTFPLLAAALPRAADTPANREIAGRLIADLWSLRRMSLHVVDQMTAGNPAGLDAAITKDIGTRFEQTLIDDVLRMVPTQPDPGSTSELERLLAQALLHSPGFTLRGGAVEILRGVIARMATP